MLSQVVYGKERDAAVGPKARRRKRASQKKSSRPCTGVNHERGLEGNDHDNICVPQRPECKHLSLNLVQ
jgi:hypothetical protein